VLRGDDVLLVRRGKEPRRGQWSLPGGAQKIGETVAAAARREVMEETGLDVEILGLVDVVDSVIYDDDGGVHYHYTLIDLAARAPAGEPRAGGDVDAVRWVALADLDGYELWEETVRVVSEAARRWPDAE
jgi:ADP-ribose pyrophosphatase YjhB (NUDIX family)